MKSYPYASADRLADVMALIQVLALDQYAHRSEDGLDGELQGAPRSANTWTEIARSHPEFFRVGPGDKTPISLIARHVLPLNEQGARELSADFAGRLLQAAIDLHDRQVRLKDRWTYLIPIWVALITGFFLLLAIAMK